MSNSEADRARIGVAEVQRRSTRLAFSAAGPLARIESAGDEKLRLSKMLWGC